MANDRVLVVEGEASIRAGIKQALESRSYEVVEATNSKDAMRLWREADPDIALLDISLPNANTLELIAALRGIDSSTPLITLAAHDSLELAVEAVKLGAELFLIKPLELTVLASVLQRSLENQRSLRCHLAETTPRDRNASDPFLGTSPAIRRLAEIAKNASMNDGAILIQGERGTGKGMLARWIHRNGTRASQPFVDLNCRGISRDLLEKKLFGYQQSSPAVVQNTRGLLEIAHKGTIFLDEIGEIDSEAQHQLLNVIDERRIRSSAGLEGRKLDIRLIAATRHDLHQRVQQGQFQESLYSRISAFTLTMPPLRARYEDIPAIVNHFLAQLNQEIGSGTREMSSDAMRALQSYPWPGNIRELRNVLERAVLHSESRILSERDLPFESRREVAAVANTPDKTLDQVERQYIQAILNQEGGRVEVAAKKLGIPRSSLYYKLKQYGLRRTGTLSQHP